VGEKVGNGGRKAVTDVLKEMVHGVEYMGVNGRGLRSSELGVYLPVV
jgi:cell division GTPase FtsZ